MNQICKNLHNYELNIVYSYDIKKTNNLYFLDTNIDLTNKSNYDLRNEICRLKNNINKIDNKEYYIKQKKKLYFIIIKKKFFEKESTKEKFNPEYLVKNKNGNNLMKLDEIEYRLFKAHNDKHYYDGIFYEKFNYKKPQNLNTNYTDSIINTNTRFNRLLIILQDEEIGYLCTEKILRKYSIHDNLDYSIDSIILYKDI